MLPIKNGKKPKTARYCKILLCSFVAHVRIANDSSQNNKAHLSFHLHFELHKIWFTLERWMAFQCEMPHSWNGSLECTRCLLIARCSLQICNMHLVKYFIQKIFVSVVVFVRWLFLLLLLSSLLLLFFPLLLRLHEKTATH